MMWRKLAISVQIASFTVAVVGIILGVAAILNDEIIPFESIALMFIGAVSGMAAVLWEEYLAWLHFERRKRRIRRGNTCRQKKSA